VIQRSILAYLVDELLNDYDVLLTPATTGAAPAGLAATGSPVFCSTWTLCGVPAVSLPLLQDGNDMPIGVQLIGARHDDARLLRTARWLVQRVAEA
jgi:Asp-tRNA(Asn)/Glu-tRNA(Gln) amidotransferase A subunit family amidase